MQLADFSVLLFFLLSVVYDLLLLNEVRILNWRCDSILFWCQCFSMANITLYCVLSIWWDTQPLSLHKYLSSFSGQIFKKSFRSIIGEVTFNPRDCIGLCSEADFFCKLPVRNFYCIKAWRNPFESQVESHLFNCRAVCKKILSILIWNWILLNGFGSIIKLL